MHLGQKRFVIGVLASLVVMLVVAGVGSVLAQAGLSLRIDEVVTAEFPQMRVSLTVRDDNGVPVTGLEASDFRIVEDDSADVVNPAEVVPQANPAAEVAVMLAIDVSGSMEGQPLESAKAAANDFLDGLASEDRAGVLAFSDEVNLDQPFPQIAEDREHDFTNDQNALKNVVNFLKAEGNTSLYDAAFKAVKMTARESRGNRAVILLTDGRDEVLGGPIGSGSKVATADDPIDEANRANIPVFTIGLGEEIDRQYLQRMALRTGGVYQETPDPEQLSQLFQNVLSQLKQQYVLMYASGVQDLASSHRLVIRVESGGEQATDGTTFGAQPTPVPEATTVGERAAEESTTSTEQTSTPEAEEEDGLLTRVRNRIEDRVDEVEDDTRKVVAGAGGLAALVVLGAGLMLRRRGKRTERCPTCGREIPVGEACPYCEGWSDEFEVPASADQPEPQAPPAAVEDRAQVPPTVQEIEPTVMVEPAEEPPSEGGPVDETRVIDRGPEHTGLFVVQQGPQSGARFEVAQKVTSLGRKEGNDIHIDHPTVSREHARVRLEGDTFVIYDLGSANGTKVNGERIEEPRPLKDGDEVQLGNTMLVFKVIT